jgi:transposase-like protein
MDAFMDALEFPQLNLQSTEARRCPWCDSFDTSLVHRGYTGPTDEVDQYFTCNDCQKITYELIAKSARDMRLGRFRAGGIFRDQAQGTRYQVSRVLKVGLNEYLVYLRPLPAALHAHTPD